MSTPILQVRNLTKRIGNKVIINHLSFEVPKGEVFGLLGPNGAGKTTTIRMMVGLMSITEGDVLIGGQSIKENYEKAIVQVGAIVENPEMYKFLSGYKNLIHFARMVPGVTKDRIQVLMTYYIVHNLTAFVVRALTEILSKSYLKERENHDNSPSTTRLTIWSSMMRCPFCAP
ncbi:ATP-binding cassette domain-containing protein [Aneurinibacillus terranovensis]|uniref:ATP-binding cassette domain-containing protein n=1 Tax=Aneurinibacillus terranovensis TaxID=278991 RepID=UPI00041B858E|nr:ATP-binding cassette domain-containing protein [Aneurinibacillus terranovensis]